MSSGDLLRNEVMSMTERGRKIYQLMSNGEQVPNSEVDQLLVEAMTSKKSTKVNSKWMIWKSILKFKRQFLVLVWCFSFFLCNILFLFVPSLWKPLKIACDLCGRKKLRTITVSLYITVFENHQKKSHFTTLRAMRAKKVQKSQLLSLRTLASQKFQNETFLVIFIHCHSLPASMARYGLSMNFSPSIMLLIFPLFI